MSRFSKPEPLSNVLLGLLKSRGLEKTIWEYRLAENWARVVGPQIAAHAQVEQLRGGKLYLQVDHPGWMQELALMKPQLLRQLDPEAGVTEIILRLSRGAPEPPETNPAHRSA